MCTNLIRGQAQYCAFEKVRNFNPSKFNLLSQLAMQASVFYQKAYELAIKPEMDKAKSLRNHVSILHYTGCNFLSQANYWMAQQYARRVKEGHAGIGMAITYMKKAYTSITQVEELKLPESVVSQYKSLVAHYLERINYLEQKNNAIFHETVPEEVDNLECLQYSHPFNLDDDLNRPFEGKEIISRLVPSEVHKLANEYKFFIEGIISEAQQSITISDRALESFKKKHDLPACLYAAFGEQKLPEDLLAKIQECKMKGGLRSIRFALVELNNVSESIEMKINNLFTQLQYEAEEDETFRKLYGPLCTQARSEELTKGMLIKLNNYRDNLRQAKMVDSSVAYTLEKENEYFELIESDKSELIKRIPKSSYVEKHLSPVASQ